MKNQIPPIQLTKNFSLDEFKCKDGTPVPSLYYDHVNCLAFNLQVLRDHIKKPIIIHSGYRTKTHNTNVGGAPASRHLIAQAADIIVKGWKPYNVHRVIEELIHEEFMKQGGLGIYDNFVHYDIRGFRSRFDFRT